MLYMHAFANTLQTVCLLRDRGTHALGLSCVTFYPQQKKEEEKAKAGGASGSGGK